MRRRQMIWLGAAAVAASLGGTAKLAFDRALDTARARISVPTRAMRTRSGILQWAEAGEGPPLLMLHGTGGGFDQGLLFCRRLSHGGWRIVAPSRFGYLGSEMPDYPSPARQADALADLLDGLGIERLPIMGGSAGAISAIEFAIRHPDRCNALVALVPATYAPGRPPMRPNWLGAAVMRYSLQSDVLFWAGMTVAQDRMVATLLATDPALIRVAAPAEQARARDILRAILPVSARAQGLLNDAEQAGDPPQQELWRIVAPTLAISLEDDRFLTVDAARHIAAQVTGARLITYPTGGHIWIGHDAEVMAEVDQFLRTV